MITPIELVLLVVVYCGPIYCVATFIIWRIVRGLHALGGKRWALVLSGAVVFQVVLTFIVWASPVTSYFRILEHIEVGSYPLESAVVASAMSKR